MTVEFRLSAFRRLCFSGSHAKTRCASCQYLSGYGKSWLSQSHLSLFPGLRFRPRPSIGQWNTGPWRCRHGPLFRFMDSTRLAKSSQHMPRYTVRRWTWQVLLHSKVLWIHLLREVDAEHAKWSVLESWMRFFCCRYLHLLSHRFTLFCFMGVCLVSFFLLVFCLALPFSTSFSGDTATRNTPASFDRTGAHVF